MKKLFIIFITTILFIMLVSCKEEKKTLLDLKDEIIKSQGKDLKNILIKNKIFAPSDINLTDPDFYYIIGNLYYNDFGFDEWTNYFFTQGIKTNNIYKKESLEFLIKYYIENKLISKIKELIKLNKDIIISDDKKFLLDFENGNNLDNIDYIPTKNQYFSILYEIIKSDTLCLTKIENQNKIINYLINIDLNNEFNQKYQNDLKEIIKLTNYNPYLVIIFSYLTKDKVSFNNYLFEALKYSNSDEEIEFLKNISYKMGERKNFYLQLVSLQSKSTLFKYYYTLEKLNFQTTKNDLYILENLLKNYNKLDKFNYNIRSKILYKKYVFEKNWINEVIKYANDYPKSYHGKTLLNLMFRSSIYQHKEYLLIPYLDKIKFESFEIIDQGIFYYLSYLIDKKNEEKWKNLININCPFSYANLVINNGKIIVNDKENSTQINTSSKIQQEEKTDVEGEIIVKKIKYLLDFKLIDNTLDIDYKNITFKNKNEILNSLYKFYEEQKNYYNAVKIASEIVYLNYGDNLFNIDLKSLKSIFPLYFKDFILKYSAQYNIEPALAFAVMREESYFKTDITSSASAHGLMQIMPSTGRFISKKIDLEIYDLSNPEDNIRMGIFYLDYLKQFFKDYPLILVCYNAGPGNAKKWNKTYKNYPQKVMYELIPIEESRHYIRKVMRSYYIYKYLLSLEDDKNKITKK